MFRPFLAQYRAVCTRSFARPGFFAPRYLFLHSARRTSSALAAFSSSFPPLPTLTCLFGKFLVLRNFCFSHAKFGNCFPPSASASLRLQSLDLRFHRWPNTESLSVLRLQKLHQLLVQQPLGRCHEQLIVASTWLERQLHRR